MSTITSSSKKKCIGSKSPENNELNLATKTTLSVMPKQSLEEREIEFIDFNFPSEFDQMIVPFFKMRRRGSSKIFSTTTSKVTTTNFF